MEAVSNGVPELPEAEGAQRRDHPGDHGRAGDHHVRRHHRAGRRHPRAHGREPAPLIGLPAGQAQQTALSQIGLAVFGSAPAFYLLQAFTAAILVLAANTAFNGFPVLASLLAARRLPAPAAGPPRRPAGLQQRHRAARRRSPALLIVAFDADVTRLIQLYIIGVFVSFTLSQAGMVRHWSRELRRRPTRRRAGAMRRSQAINAVGAVATGVVLVIVLVTKFTHGAWIVVIAMPLLFLLMVRIRRHYDTVDAELRPGPGGVDAAQPDPRRRPGRRELQRADAARAGLRPGDPARRPRPRSPSGSTRRETDRLLRRLGRRDIPVPLTVLDSPVPRHHPARCWTTSARIRRQSPARRRLRLHPGVRRRPLVGAAAAQPERAAAQGPAAVPARGDGDQRAVAAALQPARRWTPRSGRAVAPLVPA